MRKKLLSEAQVRRFQSLASIKPLNEMDSSYKMHDDEDEAAMKDDMMEEEEPMEADADEPEMDEADVEVTPNVCSIPTSQPSADTSTMSSTQPTLGQRSLRHFRCCQISETSDHTVDTATLRCRRIPYLF